MTMTATAIVTVTIEVHHVGSWGLECKMDQVHKQAVESAVGRLRQLAVANDFKVGPAEVKSITMSRA